VGDPNAQAKEKRKNKGVEGNKRAVVGGVLKKKKPEKGETYEGNLYGGEELPKKKREDEKKDRSDLARKWGRGLRRSKEKKRRAEKKHKSATISGGRRTRNRGGGVEAEKQGKGSDMSPVEWRSKGCRKSPKKEIGKPTT